MNAQPSKLTLNPRDSTAFLGVKYCALKMKSLGVPGSIVLTASIASQFCAPGLVAYTMSKHGVHALMSTAAQEYTKDGIRVNAVSPGIVDTDMPKDLEDLEGMVLATPMGKCSSRFILLASKVPFYQSRDVSGEHLFSKSRTKTPYRTNSRSNGGGQNFLVFG
jgi:NAD(P)-dependent dehydrogenase (short-subunit alcohol dehydrogenase family)